MMQRAVAFDELLRRVAELARPVGFEEAAEPMPAVAEPPAGGKLLECSYALLYICPAAPESLDSVHHGAANWLDDLLREHEDERRPMDGYLLLALDAPPSEEIRGLVREIEQDPSFCRKHVLWPEDGSWERCLRSVTVLALANVPSRAEPAHIPELPSKAEEAWKRYRKYDDNVSKVLRSILSEISLDDNVVSSDEDR